MTQKHLGRPVREALSSLPAEEKTPVILETATPKRDGQKRRDGTLRVVACREGTWIAARFLDQTPQEKEDQ